MRFAISLLLVLLAVPALAQAPEASGETGSIVGTVTDAETGETLPGANVGLVGTELRVATDIDGQFAISKVPPGMFSLEVSYIAFAVTRVDSILVAPREIKEVGVVLEAVELPRIRICECWDYVLKSSPFASRVWYYSNWEPDPSDCNCGTISPRDMPLAR